MIKAETYTVKDFIAASQIDKYSRRLKRLVELDAPSIVIDRQRELVAEYSSGNFKVGGKQELLDEVTSLERTGSSINGVYYVFKNGTRFYPNAKYGLFVCK